MWNPKRKLSKVKYFLYPAIAKCPLLDQIPPLQSESILQQLWTIVVIFHGYPDITAIDHSINSRVKTFSWILWERSLHYHQLYKTPQTLKYVDQIKNNWELAIHSDKALSQWFYRLYQSSLIATQLPDWGTYRLHAKLPNSCDPFSQHQAQ